MRKKKGRVYNTGGGAASGAKKRTAKKQALHRWADQMTQVAMKKGKNGMGRMPRNEAKRRQLMKKRRSK